MTREELRLAVCHAVDIRPSEADAVIRLVVEACVSRLRNPNRDADYSWHGEALDDAAADLEATFLPPQDPSNG
jgi:hypothetical protein